MGRSRPRHSLTQGVHDELGPPIRCARRDLVLSLSLAVLSLGAARAPQRSRRRRPARTRGPDGPQGRLDRRRRRSAGRLARGAGPVGAGGRGRGQARGRGPRPPKTAGPRCSPRELGTAEVRGGRGQLDRHAARSPRSSSRSASASAVSGRTGRASTSPTVRTRAAGTRRRPGRPWRPSRSRRRPPTRSRSASTPAAGRPRPNLQLVTVDPGTSAADAQVAAAATRPPQRPSGAHAAGKPAIVTRAQWGADESLRDCDPVVLLHHQGRRRPPHGQLEQLPAERLPGPGPGDLRVPRQRQRLVRHRLQLPRRPLRHDLRGPLRRCGPPGHRRPRRRLQHRTRSGSRASATSPASSPRRRCSPRTPRSSAGSSASVRVDPQADDRPHLRGRPVHAVARRAPPSPSAPSPGTATSTRPAAPATPSTRG